MNLPTHKDTMSSREIARVTGKNHHHLLRDIRNMEPAWEKVTKTKFGFSEYKDSTGRRLPEYHLNKTECLYIATKFNDEARARLIIRWEELEREAKEPKFSFADRHRREKLIVNKVKEQRFELICLIRQYMKRGDMAQVAKELGYSPSSVQDVMLGRQWNESIVKAMHQKAMANKEQSLFDVKGMITELNN